MIQKTRNECIDCGRCVKNCLFLEKYDMNLKGFTYEKELRYHCFLCNKCREVCPKDLSGAEIAIELRKENPKGTSFTKWMKENYKLQNNSSRESRDLLFLGCNYPGFYPKTCEALIHICEKKGVDFSVDCCKKPVAESGAETSFTPLEKLIEKKKTQRLICACTNCYHLLKGRISAEVISVYEFLEENGIGEKIQGSPAIFFPCSDRYSREIFKHIEKYLEDYRDDFWEINCCGLGGGAAKKEPGIIEETMKRIEGLQKDDIYTYCSSCSGIFGKNKLKSIKNFLSEILGVKEEVSTDYTKNVLKFKFKKRGHYEVQRKSR